MMRRVEQPGDRMGLSSALNTSLNGLRLNETKIDVLGNNIANADTNGFKASSVNFQTQLYKTVSVGSAPSAANGGTNPRQIGLGASVASITKDFSQGAVTTSTSPSDLAVQGDGFFIVAGPQGDTFTRAGQFRLNSQNQLVDPQGLRVQGYAVDDNFNVVVSNLVDIEIPLGELINTARQTENVELTGALLPYPKNDVDVQESILNIGASATGVTADPITDAAAAGNATGASLLEDLRFLGNQELTAGDTLSFSPRKGGRVVESADFAVTATSTLQELMTFMEETMAIPAGSVSIAGGVLQVTGQAGKVNELAITGSHFEVTSGGTTTTLPMGTTVAQEATGESVVNDFTVYDSLGQRIDVKVSISLDQASTPNGDGHSVFNWYAESADTTATDRLLGSGTLTFDQKGRPTTSGLQTFVIRRDDTAATSPMVVNLDLSSVFGVSDENSAQSSTLALKSQDGSAPGSLTGFVIDEAGIINGVLDNGQVTTIGQVALARFRNSDGLIEVGGNRYRVGTASGEPVVVTPGSFGSGQVISGAIELSNTDIGRSLVDLILASNNYRGNARVINSVQELVDELLILGR